MSIQDSKSANSDPVGGMLLTSFVIGSLVGGVLVFTFKGGQENYWQYRAQTAEGQIEKAQQKAQTAEEKYNALITGAAIK